MALDSIAEIYYDCMANVENTTSYFIEFFNKHAIVFNNITSFKNTEELKMYTELSSKYIESLYGKNHFNEAIENINRIQTIIDKEIQRLNAQEAKNEWYYRIVFVKGLTSYRLRDYSTSTSILKVLADHDPKNDLYKNWLDHSKYKKVEKYLNAGLILFVIILVINVAAGKAIPYILKQSMLITGLVFILASSVYNYYIRRSLRRNKI